MNLEQKLSEMADEYECNHYHECKGISDCCYDNKPIEDAFKAGFRAALELPEVKQLIEALEFATAPDMWESNGEYNERFEYKYAEWYQDKCNQALSTWKAFKENSNG